MIIIENKKNIKFFNFFLSFQFIYLSVKLFTLAVGYVLFNRRKQKTEEVLKSTRRAAFEAVSAIQLQRIGAEDEDPIDFRFVELPFKDEEDTSEHPFDPREHRIPKAPISVWMAYFVLIRLSFGAGMLAIPLAVSQAGVIFGPIMVIAVGLLLMHTHNVLLWCKNEVARQLRIPRISYRYGFRVALLHGPPCLHCLGRHAPGIVAVFMMMSQVGICTVFVIFTSDNVRDIMDWKSNGPGLLCLYVPYIILELYMKNMKRVGQVALFGTGLNFVAMMLVLWEMLHGPGMEFKLLPSGIVAVLFSLGIMYFNMSALAVCLSLERSLADPKKMTDGLFSVIRVGFLVPTFLSCMFGFMGYWAFGGMEENILRYLPFDSVVAQTSFAVYLVSVALGYPVQCHPTAQILVDVVKNHDPLVTPSNSSLTGLEYFFRPAFVTMTFLIAYLVPFQGPFVAFTGNLCTTLLALVFPALMEIGIRYPSNFGAYHYILIKDLFIVALGLISWVFGVALCTYLIYIKLQ